MQRVITVHEACSSVVLTDDGVESRGRFVLGEHKVGVVGPSLLLEQKVVRRSTVGEQKGMKFAYQKLEAVLND